MSVINDARAVYEESRVSNAHVHIGRFVGSLVLFAVLWGVGFAAAEVLLDIGTFDPFDVGFYVLFGSLGAWFQAAATTSFLAGLGGAD